MIRTTVVALIFVLFFSAQAHAVKVKGKYLRPGDVVCRSGHDVGSYYYHKYNKHYSNVASLFSSGVCWEIDTTKSIIAIARKTEKQLYEYSINLVYWHNGRKVSAYTNYKNIR